LFAEVSERVESLARAAGWLNGSGCSGVRSRWAESRHLL